MRLKEKISIITGAASGFGEGIAKKFSEEGAKLILADINKDLLEKVSTICLLEGFGFRGQNQYSLCLNGEPDRVRTCDPLIKSQLLYQLS